MTTKIVKQIMDLAVQAVSEEGAIANTVIFTTRENMVMSISADMLSTIPEEAWRPTIHALLLSNGAVSYTMALNMENVPYVYDINTIPSFIAMAAHQGALTKAVIVNWGELWGNHRTWLAYIEEGPVLGRWQELTRDKADSLSYNMFIGPRDWVREENDGSST